MIRAHNINHIEFSYLKTLLVNITTSTKIPVSMAEKWWYRIESSH